MDMKDYFDIEYTKRKLKKYLENGAEPELCIKIEGKNYMIIPLRDKISFQWIGVTDEVFYKDVEELFSKELINEIVLKRDWNKIEDIWYY